MKKWLPLIILVLAMAGVFFTGLQNKLSLEYLQENKEFLLDYSKNNPFLSALIFCLAYIVFVALSLPAATLLTLSGGFLFGKVLGTLYVVVSATIGATIIFQIAKTSLGEALRNKAGGLYKKVEKNMEDNVTGYMFFMRLVPVFPFFLVNIVPALFNVKARTYILTTFFGILPGSFVYVNLGKQLATINSLNDLVSTQTLLAFSLLGVFALIPTLYKQFSKKSAATAVAILCLLFNPNVGHAEESYDKFLINYDQLLKDYTAKTQVDGIHYEGVNYDAWSKDKKHKESFKLLQAVKIEEFKNKKDKIAFWINAYNFLTINLIIEKDEKKSIKNLGTLLTNPWKRFSWKLNGKKYTLDQIEHEILRPIGAPEIHFAINCASVSCPDLRTESFRADKLEAQYKDQIQAMVKNTKKGVNKEGNVVYLNKIFKWFSDDFNKDNVKSWLKENIDISGDFEIEYLDYDWSLNKIQ